MDYIKKFKIETTIAGLDRRIVESYYDHTT